MHGLGAGAAGASAAYYLAQYAHNASVPLNITIFEANSYIGGRSTTVNAYDLTDDDLADLRSLAFNLEDEYEYSVELGASIFVSINKILKDAVENFNLTIKSGDDNPKGHTGSDLGIWDGESFIVELDGSLNGYWDVAKLLWKYGLAPVKTQRLMKTVVGKFMRMYEEPIFPFTAGLTAAAQAVGLTAVTAATGEQYMRENGIKGAFGREIVQASTRVNYAQNLEFIHGLEAMVCMATDGAVAVEGGNWRIFQSMIEASGAHVLLGERVSEIIELDVGGHAISTSSQQVWRGDHIIIAGPYQYTNITSSMLDEKHAFHKPDPIPYVELHVTLFTSPHLLSPTFFNLSPDKAVPQVVLTSLPDGEPAKSGQESVGKPGFFSISLLRSIVNPKTGADEYLYKIFSPESPTSAWLEALLGIKPEDSNPNRNSEDITWLYRKVWNSYPYEYPRMTFESAKLKDGIWYTGGMDSFISTMETNALMGKNVARLIVDEENVMKQRQSNSGLGEEKHERVQDMAQMKGKLDL